MGSPEQLNQQCAQLSGDHPWGLGIQFPLVSWLQINANMISLIKAEMGGIMGLQIILKSQFHYPSPQE